MKFISLVAATALFATSACAAPAPVAQPDYAAAPFVQVVKRDCSPVDGFFDNAPTKAPITFNGAWEHLNGQGEKYKFGTISYTSEPNAEVVIPTSSWLPAEAFTADKLSIWSSRKNDRGEFNVYLGKTLLGTGNQYTDASEETASEAVFTIENVQIPGGEDFVVKNDKGATYMAFDALQLVYCA